METLNRSANPAVRVVGLALGIVTMAGCATSQQSASVGADNAMRAQFEQRIKQKESEIDSLKVSLTEAQTSLAVTTAEGESTTVPLLPRNAKAGEYAGSLDGIVGPATLAAVNAYQRKQDLPSGGITLEMLKRLKVSI